MAANVKHGLHAAVQALVRPLVGTPEKPPLLWKFRSSKSFIIVAISFVIFTDIYQYG